MTTPAKGDGLDPAWDSLLGEGLVDVPPGFHDDVMLRVRQEGTNGIGDTPRRFATSIRVLRALGIVIAAVAAGWQTLAFVFGLWVATSAL